LLLGGTDPASLSCFDWIDVAEAAIIEPVVNGARGSLDEVLDKLRAVLEEMMPDPATWGTSAAAQAGLAAAEALFG
jgi:hypothetical protein